ncbi:MAG: hypothetical protein V1807_00280 [Patescibacteria group bacterium]
MKIKPWVIIVIVFAIVEISGLIMIQVRHNQNAKQVPAPIVSADDSSHQTINGIAIIDEDQWDQRVKDEIASSPNSLEDKYLGKSSEELDAQFQAESDWIASQPGYDDNITPNGKAEDRASAQQSPNIVSDIPAEVGLYIDSGSGWKKLSVPEGNLSKAFIPVEDPLKGAIQVMSETEDYTLCFFDEVTLSKWKAQGISPIIWDGVQTIKIATRLTPEGRVNAQNNPESQRVMNSVVVYPLSRQTDESTESCQCDGDCYVCSIIEDMLNMVSDKSDYDVGGYAYVDVGRPKSASGLYVLGYCGSLILLQQSQ